MFGNLALVVEPLNFIVHIILQLLANFLCQVRQQVHIQLLARDRVLVFGDVDLGQRVHRFVQISLLALNRLAKRLLVEDSVSLLNLVEGRECTRMNPRKLARFLLLYFFVYLLHALCFLPFDGTHATLA